MVIMTNTLFAIVFTAIGFMIARSYLKYKYDKTITITVECTIDSLIKDNYLRVKGEGENQELLKWYEDLEHEE